MKNKLLILPGYLIGLGSLFIITYRTLLAFLSGSQSITLYINRYEEQYADIFFLAIIWVICLLGLLYLYKSIKEERKTDPIDNNIIGKKVINKDGIDIGILYNSILDEKTGLVSKLYVKPTSNIDTNLFQVNENGNIVLNFDKVVVRKEDILIK